MLCTLYRRKRENDTAWPGCSRVFLVLDLLITIHLAYQGKELPVLGRDRLDQRHKSEQKRQLIGYMKGNDRQ